MTTSIDYQPLAAAGGTPIRTSPFPGWPVFDATEEEAILGVLRSGSWFLGERVAEFERTFTEYCEAKHGVSVSSGTVALQVALEAAGVVLGDEVIVPSYTFIATASSVALVGGVPVFVDVDPDTYLIDPAAVEAAITEKTKAIIAVHIAGQPADLDALTAIAAKHGVLLIEDSAQAHAAAWKGRRVGAIGDLGTFSFQASKNLNAGEGGFIVTDDEELHLRAWSIHNCGRAPGGEWYEHPLVGGNYRLTEMQAALALSQLRRLDEQTEKRTHSAALLTEQLSEIEGIRPLAVDERVTRHAFHLYVFRYDADAFGGASREQFLKALAAEGIPCAAGYKPLYREPAFQARFSDFPLSSPAFGGRPDYSGVHCPVTERICADEAVWLTQNLLLGTESDVSQISEAIAKIAAQPEALAAM
ncbi:MAG: DegT/DnrJ/EryC1/StrS family aminotransferase [Candidatus Latescibacterota bacterium]|nr:DegT/DnrJ/EryC1/StrS family aminotransferase [Candidatus Latescibacterota bacterium]